MVFNVATRYASTPTKHLIGYHHSLFKPAKAFKLGKVFKLIVSTLVAREGFQVQSLFLIRPKKNICLFPATRPSLEMVPTLANLFSPEKHRCFTIFNNFFANQIFLRFCLQNPFWHTNLFFFF